MKLSREQSNLFLLLKGHVEDIFVFYDFISCDLKEVFIYPLGLNSGILIDDEGISAELLFLKDKDIEAREGFIKKIFKFLLYLAQFKGFLNKENLSEVKKYFLYEKDLKENKYFDIPFKKQNHLGMVSYAYFRQSDYIKIKFTLALIDPEKSFKGKKVFKSKWLLPQQIAYAYFCAICDLFELEKPQKGKDYPEDIILYSPRDLYEIFKEKHKEAWEEQIENLKAKGFFNEDYMPVVSFGKIKKELGYKKITLKCWFCGKEFTTFRKDTHYCPKKSCRTLAYRVRKALENKSNLSPALKKHLQTYIKAQKELGFPDEKFKKLKNILEG